MVDSTNSQRKLIEAIAGSSTIPELVIIGGEHAYFDEDLQLYLSFNIYSDGGAFNSNNGTGWIRRFNGVHQSDTTGPVYELGLVIIWAEFSCADAKPDRKLEIHHYSPDPDSEGKRDFTFADQIEINRFNRFGSFRDKKILIPGDRVLAFSLSGGSFRQPQFSYGFRRVL